MSMTIDRRRALALFGLGGAGAAGEAMAAAKPRAYFAGRAAFLHGVASGDPLEDRVVLWTRITAEATTAPIAVRWDVATDAAFKAIVRQGQATAVSARDYTVKVDVTGLKPATDYFYRFRYVKNGKPFGKGVGGRTRTLPKGQVPDVVLAVVSCALYPNGYFNAYDAIAKLPRVDAVLHLGDYIYEYGAAPGDYGMDSPTAKTRAPDPPRELLSLEDYRRRHAQYKTDPALQAAHARAPWIVVWDDHETADNSWIGGAENHQPATEGDWAKRKAAGDQGLLRVDADPRAGGRDPGRGVLAPLPVRRRRHPADDRDPADGPHPPAGLRPRSAGQGRQARRRRLRRQAGRPGSPDDGPGPGAVAGPRGRRLDEGRHGLAGAGQPGGDGPGGPARPEGDHGRGGLRRPVGQAARLCRQARGGKPGLSQAGLPGNLDAWDGYPADRARVYDIFKAGKARPIVLAGDSHAFWANELWDDAGATRVAAEFGVTSVTSPGYGDYLPGAPLDQAYVARNKEVKFTDQAAKGFLLLTLEHGRATGELIAVSTILDPKYQTRVLKRFVVTPGDGGGVKALAEG
jgi:alkaline phosphatase D